ncbi:uncharacterized protein LOC116596045 isoform X2 [Mustela erminea]|uniref:uncharacterized protein LOC116596045 isoform X2 n=1 Tax=Mustela erminea TaxID=36723 RepID=UPI0013868FB9|nr:uncharacterized protein LOC116596045 isoform X2 [Mustela erminea]
MGQGQRHGAGRWAALWAPSSPPRPDPPRGPAGEPRLDVKRMPQCLTADSVGTMASLMPLSPYLSPTVLLLVSCDLGFVRAANRPASVSCECDSHSPQSQLGHGVLGCPSSSATPFPSKYDSPFCSLSLCPWNSEPIFHYPHRGPKLPSPWWGNQGAGVPWLKLPLSSYSVECLDV